EGNAAFGQAVSVVVHHQLHGIDDVIKVQQRLAHAHHHYVGDTALTAFALLVEAHGRHIHLANDFGHAEIAVKTLLTGGAETAIESALNLRTDTESPAVFIVHVHGFSGAAATHPHHPLTRTVFVEIFVTHFRQADFCDSADTLTQRFAHVGHTVEVG